MAKRGPKSAAEQLTTVTGFASRLPPPAHLTPEQAQEWTAIVDSLPGDYFRPGDVSLLATFCVSTALYKHAANIVQTEGMMMTADNGRMYAHPAVGVMQAMSGSIAQMAVKLRLCPSTRYSTRAASSKTGDAAKPRRPWERAGGAE